MIYYRRKYNHNKPKARPWFGVSLDNYRLTSKDQKIYDFRIDGVVYTILSDEFREAYEKHLLWSRLGG